MRLAAGAGWLGYLVAVALLLATGLMVGSFLVHVHGSKPAEAAVGRPQGSLRTGRPIDTVYQPVMFGPAAAAAGPRGEAHALVAVAASASPAAINDAPAGGADASRAALPESKPGRTKRARGRVSVSRPVVPKTIPFNEHVLIQSQQRGRCIDQGGDNRALITWPCHGQDSTQAFVYTPDLQVPRKKITKY
jgi:hypothetical protein